MKNLTNKSNFCFNTFIIICLCAVLFSCHIKSDKWVVPSELIGEWKTSEINVNVRTKVGFLKYEFTPGDAIISFKVDQDKYVSGSLGLHKFQKGRLTYEGSYKIVCDSVGKIFLNDPLDLKEVSIWLYEPFKNGMEAELRYTENGQKYPMSGFTLSKVK